jgi:hypothetical protein
VTPRLARIFAGLRLPAQAGGEVQRASPVAALDRDGFPRVEPDPHGQRQLGVVDRLLDEAFLQVDRGSHGLAGRREHRERLVATELDHLAAALRDDLAGDAGELGRELGSNLVAALLREQGPTADVGDQEGADLSLLGLDARSARLFVHQPPGSSGSVPCVALQGYGPATLRSGRTGSSASLPGSPS